MFWNFFCKEKARMYQILRVALILSLFSLLLNVSLIIWSEDPILVKESLLSLSPCQPMTRLKCVPRSGAEQAGQFPRAPRSRENHEPRRPRAFLSTSGAQSWGNRILFAIFQLSWLDPGPGDQARMVLDQEDPIGKNKGKNVLPGSLTTVGVVVLLERLRVRMDRGIWKKLLPTAPCPHGQMLPKSVS